MGVTGLWTIVQPCARPIKLETLNKKRLAVDASIWIYQFLKAVRDKEGNALRNSHVVGFFRRICKLLFFGIKPVFVFDGGAPALKRQTISGRKARREGKREDAVRTAGRLLAVQMQRRAEDEDRKRREERDRPAISQEEVEIPENLVYVDELHMTEQERQRNRQFKKKDAYHLPDLDVSLAEMGAPNDPRIMSHEELEEYAKQFHTGEDVNVYDFSKMDFNSPMFLSLPASDRYNILNAARLRSRLRMGYSKDQLDTMFPDRMAFSRFQIDRVKERNELTTRLMNINGMNGEDAMLGFNGAGRVAGEKGKEYVLVKNDGVEGGWALGVVSNKQEGERNKPIDVEGIERDMELKEEDQDNDEWEDDGFVDVPIEGLNRLPKLTHNINQLHDVDAHESDKPIELRKRLGSSHHDGVGPKRAGSKEIPEEDPESLFIPQVTLNGGRDTNSEDHDDALFENVNFSENEEDELNRAIAMSLEKSDDDEKVHGNKIHQVPKAGGPRIDQPLEFNQENAKFGRTFAHSTNARARGNVSQPFSTDNDDDMNLDLQAALSESRRSKHKSHVRTHMNGLQSSKGPPLSPMSNIRRSNSPADPSSSAVDETASQTLNAFDGPLPFESISLGKSLFSKKKKKQVDEDAGGFEKEIEEPKKKAAPLPPWFSGDIREGHAAQKLIEESQYDGGNPDNSLQSMDDHILLKRQKTGEVIDLEAPITKDQDIIELQSSSDEDDTPLTRESLPVDTELRMGDVADLVRAEPPSVSLPQNNNPLQPSVDVEESPDPELDPDKENHVAESVEWEDSDADAKDENSIGIDNGPNSLGNNVELRSSRSSSPEFENVSFSNSSNQLQSKESIIIANDDITPVLTTAPSYEQELGDIIGADEDTYSDPEDDELMRQLAIEAEEHARFASTLNAKSQLQNAEDYERELRQLRNQQKKDRRDADEVSHIMVTECQQLLKLFGLPYVTAPMEAEAQCAELVSLGLVDGIVTDDSDIFLFGGTRVYKNMFNQAKFVECYLTSDLEKEYSLDRQKVIQIAHLLGSDYTEGIPSIGPVTALEILSEFDSLESFKDWWSQVQMGHKFPEDTSSSFRRKFRRNAAKLFLPPTFPDKRVDHAYLHPDVDSDPSAFAWGVPDLDALRQFLMGTIGWSQERADEILVPVIKDMNRRETEGTQANITQFFGGTVGVGARQKSGNSGGSAFAPRRKMIGKSQRMENALGILHARAKERTIGEADIDADANSNHQRSEEEGGVVSEEDGTEAGASTEQVGHPITTQPRIQRSQQKKRSVPVEAPATDSDTGDNYDAPVRMKRRKRGVRK